jgi:hypothetical protein
MSEAKGKIWVDEVAIVLYSTKHPQTHPIHAKIKRQDDVTYKHDIFLSYRRHNEWPRFIEEHFLPQLRHWLDTTRGRTTRIFFDQDQIEAGEAWPHALADGLAHSRIMLCLWSREYFSSKWCRAELSHMLARRKSLTKAPNAPPPLVIAVIIHDTEKVHPGVKDIQTYRLQGCCNPWMAKGSSTAERLSTEIERLAGDVAKALTRTPKFNPQWPELATEEFWKIFSNPEPPRFPPSLG